MSLLGALILLLDEEVRRGGGRKWFLFKNDKLIPEHGLNFITQIS
jgi:hypothetical protein